MRSPGGSDPAGRRACDRNNLRHTPVVPPLMSNARSGISSMSGTRISPVGRIVPKRSGTSTSPGRQYRNVSGWPRRGVTGRATRLPRWCRACSSGRRSISSPIGQKPETMAPIGGGQSRSTWRPAPRRRAQSPSHGAANAACRAARLAASRSFIVASEISAEPPWPLACHPPRACVCRWAPDTETKIPTEPAPEGDAYWPRGCVT